MGIWCMGNRRKANVSAETSASGSTRSVPLGANLQSFYPGITVYRRWTRRQRKHWVEARWSVRQAPMLTGHYSLEHQYSQRKRNTPASKGSQSSRHWQSLLGSPSPETEGSPRSRASFLCSLPCIGVICDALRSLPEKRDAEDGLTTLGPV